jgi:hypothetical protein
MRVIEAEFESNDANEYNFFGCVLNDISSEPFFLRHEYYMDEKDLKQSLFLFGRRPEERGTQIFVYKYFDYLSNSNFMADQAIYKKQAANFRLPDKDKLSSTYLLEIGSGEKDRQQFMTKDGRYRRRIVYDIKGEKDALMIIFSIDSKLFGENKLFQFFKKSLTIAIE